MEKEKTKRKPKRHLTFSTTGLSDDHQTADDTQKQNDIGHFPKPPESQNGVIASTTTTANSSYSPAKMPRYGDYVSTTFNVQSPLHKSPKSTSFGNTSTVDLDGYVVVVSTFKSKPGNEFFDVKLKNAESSCVTIRILKQSNQTIEESYLKSLSQGREPVTFKNLSKTQNGIFFFNTSRGSTIQKCNSVNFKFDDKHFQTIEYIKTQKTGIFDIVGCLKWLHEKKDIQSPKVKGNLREAVLYDHTGNICVTVWGDLIDSIQEGKLYEFHNLVLKNFFGLKLATTTSTSVSSSDTLQELPALSDADVKEHIDHEEEIQDKLNPKLCCPELLGTNVSVGPACINVNCGKPLPVVPGNRTVTCINCNSTMRVDKCQCVFNCTLSFPDITLMLPVDVASEYFKEDVLKMYQRDEKAFRETLCFLDNVDYTYNSRNVITNMKNH